MDWGDYSAYYPAEMLQKMRAKRLMGPGGAVPHQEMSLSVMDIDPGAHYPPHRHEAPEAYYVVQGEAECEFGDERLVARPGSAIYTRSGRIHSFRNTGEEKFVAVAFWWAPAGNAGALQSDLVLELGLSQ